MADAPIVSRPSRYRSQRAPQHLPPAQPQAPSSPDAQNATTATQDAVSRSRSRYKRVNAVPDVPLPVIGATEGNRQADSRSPPRSTAQVRATETGKRATYAGGSPGAGGTGASTAEPLPSDKAAAQSRSRPDTRHASNVKQVDRPFVKEAAGQTQGNSSSQRAQDSAASSPPEASHVKQTSIADLFPPPVLPAPKPTSSPHGPPASNQIRATKSLTHLPRAVDVDRDGEAGCFAMFKRKRVEPATASSSSSSKEAEIPPLPTKTREPQTIRPGGGGAVPGTDAPVSAVNAGDRYVLVECESSKTIFPVKPTTNPVDIIKSASLCMSEHIDVQSAVLYESFGTVGVLRPLRRYEHIRDVMNSWDHDRENSLVLFRYNAVDVTGTELSVAGAPQDKPAAEQSWTLLYSQKPGKWEKKFVTLKPDGQLTMQKDATKPKDLTVLCRLSDFDIYIPTQEKLRKKVRPPKRHCFAVKSQQKTAMFESTQNFIHFFSTGDTATADSFYAAAQSWRSWYLVHVLDEGRKPKIVVDGLSAEEERKASAGGNLSNGQTQHKTADSVGSQYQLGSFRPLIDLERFNDDGVRPFTATSTDVHHSRETSAGFTKFENTVALERRTSRSKSNYPPGSMTRGAQLADDEPLVNLARRNSSKLQQQQQQWQRSSLDQTRHDRAEEFASNGLLGRSYSQRQREQAVREQNSANDAFSENPFSAGPTLLNLNGADPNVEEGNLNSISNSYSMPRRAPSNRNGPDTANRTTDLKRYSSLNRHNSTDERPSTGLKRIPSNDPCQNTAEQNSDSLNHRTSQRNMPKPLIDLTPSYQDPPQHNRKGRAFRPPSSAAYAGAAPGGPLIDNATSPEDPLGLPANTAWKMRRSGSNAGGGSGGGMANGRYSSHVGVVNGGANATNGIGSGNGSGNGALLDMSEPDQFAPGTLLNRVEMVTKPKELVIDRSKDH